MSEKNKRGKIVAIITGAFSVLIAFIYLILIVILDARGPMAPPPPEAFGMVATPSFPFSLRALQHVLMLFL